MRHIAAYLLAFAVFFVGEIAGIILGASNLFSYVIDFVVIVILFSFAGYWAFSIRRALVAQPYRNQALGIGLVTLIWGLLVALSASPFFTSNLVAGYFLVILIFCALVLTFYWIDASLLAARRSDPRLRNTFHWRRLRIVFWVWLLVVPISISLYLFLTGDSNLIVTGSILAYAQLPTYLYILTFLLFVSPVVIPGISGVLLLTIASRRSADRTLRKHLMWFGIFVIILILEFIDANILFSFVNNEPLLLFTVQNALLVGEGYSLYESAHSLAPLNKLPVLEKEDVSL